MKVLYINYVDMISVSSGSELRPLKVYQAMLSLGWDVTLVAGRSLRRDRKKRKKYLEERWKEIQPQTYDFCYIEAMTDPLYKGFNYFEYSFIKKIKKAGIPIGVFYRDVYWKFRKLFNLTGAKQYIISLFQKIDVRFWKKYAKTIFLPSEKMNDYLNFERIKALPPGCMSIKESVKKTNEIKNTLIYVGGVSKSYGSDMLIEAMRIVNEKRMVKLILVCREKEKSFLDSILQESDSEWLTIKHSSGDELISLYSEADAGLLPLQKNKYTDFCVAVKLFEYLSNRLFVITTNCDEMAAIVTRSKMGLVSEAKPIKYASAILNYYEDAGLRETFEDNIDIFILENGWTKRVLDIKEGVI